MLSKLMEFLLVLLFSSGRLFATQTIFLDHASPVCSTVLGGGGVALIGTWNNTNGCTQTTTHLVGTGSVCVDTTTADGPADCHFFFCCCFTQSVDKDSRTINDSCALSSISAQVTSRKICD